MCAWFIAVCLPIPVYLGTVRCPLRCAFANLSSAVAVGSLSKRFQLARGARTIAFLVVSFRGQAVAAVSLLATGFVRTMQNGRTGSHDFIKIHFALPRLQKLLLGLRVCELKSTCLSRCRRSEIFGFLNNKSPPECAMLQFWRKSRAAVVITFYLSGRICLFQQQQQSSQRGGNGQAKRSEGVLEVG